jgi:hypothetical protein
MNAILLTLSLCLANVIVDAETVEGESYHGEVASWSDSALVIRDGEQRHELATDRLQRIRGAREVALPVRPNAFIAFHDGTQLSVTAVQSDGDQATLKTSWGTVTCPLREIHTIRWNPGEDERDDSWQAMLRNELTGDALIVRRDADHLDFLEGTVQSISEAAVRFEFDGQDLDLPLERLAGVIFFRSPDRTDGGARFQVNLRDQSVWQGTDISVSGGHLVVRTVGGVKLSAPLTEMTEVTFAPQSLIYVSDLQPEQLLMEPLLQPTRATQKVLDFLYRPRMNEAFAAKPLQLQFPDDVQPTVYTKGLAIHSRTHLIYRLEEPFREVRGVVGWDPDFRRNGGTVQLLLRVGGETIFDAVWKPDDPPVEIALPLNEAKRLELIVDYADGSDVGDHLNLCNLRLIK